jgi:putative transposase
MGKFCYLYRASDRDGQLVDSMLSATRDMAAAQRFFRGALAAVGHRPKRVTTDGHDSYPRAIKEVLGNRVEHRCNQYLNNRLEQDYRGIKQRYYPMLGFRAFDRHNGSARPSTNFATIFVPGAFRMKSFRSPSGVSNSQ